MSDRAFSHPNFGSQVRVEQNGREVRLVFVARSHVQADDLADELLRQLKSGALHLTLMGKPTGVVEQRS